MDNIWVTLSFRLLKYSHNDPQNKMVWSEKRLTPLTLSNIHEMIWLKKALSHSTKSCAAETRNNHLFMDNF